MPTENILDALGLDALTGFSEETWAEFLLGLAQHSSDINRFFGRHEEAHWGTLTIGQVKEWYEWRRRQQYGLEAPQPPAYPEISGPGRMHRKPGESVDSWRSRVARARGGPTAFMGCGQDGFGWNLPTAERLAQGFPDIITEAFLQGEKIESRYFFYGVSAKEAILFFTDKRFVAVQRKKGKPEIISLPLEEIRRIAERQEPGQSYGAVIITVAGGSMLVLRAWNSPVRWLGSHPQKDETQASLRLRRVLPRQSWRAAPAELARATDTAGALASSGDRAPACLLTVSPAGIRTES